MISMSTDNISINMKLYQWNIDDRYEDKPLSIEIYYNVTSYRGWGTFSDEFIKEEEIKTLLIKLKKIILGESDYIEFVHDYDFYRCYELYRGSIKRCGHDTYQLLFFIDDGETGKDDLLEFNKIIDKASLVAAYEDISEMYKKVTALRIKNIEPLSDYKLFITFYDDKSIIYDFKKEKSTQHIYESFKDNPDSFKLIELDKTGTLIEWYGCLGMTSDFFYEYGESLTKCETE